ncbi:hypothetical protein H9X88_13030 [Aeromonas hydrophila]|uniref:hypothetical protein n=1 Tax=Aeromonas TaxID=642 RepID=UPI00111B7BD4|nr:MULTISPECIES: hypothetical protein [Aeromonas]MBQ4677178.1 hypothetical protein [Aeromonas hydrophila]MBW3813782.1 hypothetical protein [Aeromonas hydrophila]MCF7679011.1 hypothetical protein [Aeromonas hydrophila]MCF7692059.1 hypothetical protein [Aeromonas hydrophila]MCF7772859.1 hypothetical protein [Aeromonas hydrophila]
MDLPEKITLKAYVSVLHGAAKGNIPNLHKITEDKILRRIVKELIDAGLLSDGRQAIGTMSIVSEITLTPAGASALLEWSDYLSQQTLWYKFGKAAMQLAWVLIGAIAASIPKLLGIEG